MEGRKLRVHGSCRIDNLQVPEIGLVHAKVPGKDAVGVDKGVGADEKISQNMEAPGQGRLAFGAGRFEGMTARAAVKSTFFVLPCVLGPSRPCQIERFFV